MQFTRLMAQSTSILAKDKGQRVTKIMVEIPLDWCFVHCTRQFLGHAFLVVCFDMIDWKTVDNMDNVQRIRGITSAIPNTTLTALALNPLAPPAGVVEDVLGPAEAVVLAFPCAPVELDPVPLPVPPDAAAIAILLMPSHSLQTE
jgi:hypothetical protein